MIESRQDVLHLLQEYIDKEHELDPLTLSDIGNKYHNGVVCGKFREEDNATMLTLKIGVSDNALYNEIYEYCKRNNRTQREFQELQILPINEWIKKYCSWIYLLNEVEKLSDQEIKVLLFLYYSFRNYKAMPPESPYDPDISYLAEDYKNIFNKQSTFGKYGIVPIDQDRTLLPIFPPRIYDQSLDKTFYTKNIPLSLLKQFSAMLFNGMIINLAVRLKNERGYNGKIRAVPLIEALERGELFKLVNLCNYSVSKLYSKNYNDSLWVVIDPPNITFEELCDNFEDHNDMIVTQVVHLQYENLEDESYITHLDHEYVFYTLDEYEKRQNDPKQKGEAQKRLKSFKIDNSKIPFTFNFEIHRKDENGNDLLIGKEQFLCYVLECYFTHKDLLDEYFQKVKHNSLTCAI